MGSGFILNKAIEKYSKENFSVRILEECNSIEELNEKEKYWIKYFNADLSKDYYNIVAGGSNERAFRGKNNPMYGKHHTKETRKKMSENNNSWNRGTHGLFSKEHRDKISKSLKRHYSIPENIAKLSERFSGNKNGMYGKHLTEEAKRKMSNSLTGHEVSLETREKISKAKKGKPLSKETKEKISISRKGISPGNKNKISIYKDNKFIYIDKLELDNYITNGWKLGMGNTIKHSTTKNKVCINNGFKNKYIKEIELDYYLSIGWMKGGRKREQSKV